MKTSEEGVSQSDVELGRVSRERNPHRSTQLTNCPAALPLTSLPSILSLSYSQLLQRKPGEFRWILSRVLLHRVFYFDRTLPSSKNAIAANWQRSLLINSDSHRRTFPTMLFRDGYGKRRIEARFVCPYIRYMFHCSILFDALRYWYTMCYEIIIAEQL